MTLVLDAYGLRPSGRPSRERDGVVRIATTAGDKAVRRYPPARATPAIEYEHALERTLASRAFPVVRINRTLDGGTIVRAEGDRFAVFDDVAGPDLHGRRRRAARVHAWSAAGSLLARFHLLLREAPRAPDGIGTSDGVGSALTTLEALANERPPASNTRLARNWRWLREHTLAIAEPLAAAERGLAGAPMSRTVVHGAFGARSVRFRREGAPVLVELEHAHEDRRLTDLVDVLSAAVEPDAAAFLAGYDGVHGDRGEEWRLLGSVWCSHRL
ncbi:MAG TPA: phosphotransferase, partial [Actinomycetota bacterium]|nr:phosphotransferase [Actinomycetota bacterium]